MQSPESRSSNAVVLGFAMVIAALALPVIVLIFARPDHNVGDIALIELRIRDVLSSHTPLVGAYSRYGWSHPGPLMFDLFAVPYRVFGNDARALRITTLLFNLAVLVPLVLLLRRRGAAALVAIGAGTMMLLWGLQPDALANGWNVMVVNLPMVLVVVACWCALCGDRDALLVAALAASFVFQTHVGVGVVIAPLFLSTVAIMAWRAWQTRDGDDGAARRWGIGAAIVALTTIPILYDSLTNWPGNLGAILRWSASNDEPSVGIGDGIRMIGRTSSLSFPFHPEFPGRFLLGIDEISVGLAPGILLVLLAVAGVVSVRARWRAESRLCGALGLLWLSAIVAASTITLPLGWWLVEWLQPLGWLTWAAVALVAWRALQHLTSGHDLWPTVRRATFVAVTGLAVFTIIDHARQVADSDDRQEALVEPVETLYTAAKEFVSSSPDAPIRIDFEGSALSAETMMSGVVNRIDADGGTVCVDASLGYKFSAFRVCPPEIDTGLLIRNEPAALPAPAGSVALVISDPLTPAEREEADRLTTELAAILVADGRGAEVPSLSTELAGAVLVNDPSPELLAAADDVQRLEELRQRPGLRYVLYGFDRSLLGG